MKASFAVDSEGVVVNTSKALNIFRVRNKNRRYEELNTFIDGFLFFLNNQNINLTKEGIYSKIQPMYTEDRIVFFSKIPLEASSSLVKQSHALQTNRLVGEVEPKLKRQLESVCFTQEREKTKWWLLLAEEVLFERNIFDCEWEKMSVLKTVTYSAFLKNNRNLIKDKDAFKGTMNYGYCFADDFDITDTENILKNAIVRNGVDPHLDECIRKALIKVQEVEARTVEQPEATKQIKDMARLVLKAITNQKPITILTDYDADGICAAYQIDNLAHTLNPDINLEVICNDRREAYGVPKFVKPKPDMQYIIFDTGCNELDYIFSAFGENTLVIDHHIIDDPDYRQQFNIKPNLLNPHSISENDAENAQYCATGLSYRICEEIIKTIEETISRGNDTLSEVLDILKSHDGNMEQFENKCRENGILVSQEHITTGEWKEQPVLVSNTAICDKETGEVLFSVGLAQNRETGKMLSEFGNVYLPFGRTAPTYITEKGEIRSPITEKLKNTNVIMAGIGTVADVVNILDEHSHNRAIVKNALAAIDNADENNTNYVIGYMLAKNGIGEEQALAKKIAFNIAPFINSAGRLSEVMGENGAQRMYNALTSDPSKPSTYQEIDALVELNGERKSLKMKLTKSENYLNTVDAYRCGGEAEDKKISICILPDNTPSAFCGLIASDLTGAIDKPAIVLVYNTEKGYYTGSARNTERGQSLKGFVDFAVSQPEAAELNINYGGHNDAIGISHLNNPSLFKTVIELYQDYFDSSAKEQTLLKISHSDLSKPETLEKVLALEPLGAGNKLPKFIVEGEELERNRNFIKNNPRWKDISIEDNGKRVKIRDWCYSAAAYPQAEGSQNVKFLASADLSDYHGLHIEAKAEYSHTLIKERYKTIEREHKNKLNNISKE